MAKYIFNGKAQIGISYKFKFFYEHDPHPAEEGLYTHCLQIGFWYISWGEEKNRPNYGED